MVQSFEDHCWKDVVDPSALEAARRAGIPIIYTTNEARAEANVSLSPDSWRIEAEFATQPGDLSITFLIPAIE